ncbi:hypothetical protein Poly30_11540 [Planctomycetes bacterium Poly30]|uniref:DUF1501 domain-containing protein n=1 Tax=Saltatorellus ferox TaxID=2528018 RepID=A0A518ENJ2_9BACT|nr:hypothetical protein Poly30_11540 [Planctomycetes bacterium Poly30]
MYLQPKNECAEYARLSRRGFLGASAAGAAALCSPRLAFSNSRGSGSARPTVIGLFLRGAMDGLSVVVPYGDSDLYVHRPTLAVPPPGAASGALDLDGFFGLNPNAAALMPAYQAGTLGFVHACGSTDPSRSHFSAMQSMETGTPDHPGSGEVSGWLARHLQSVAPSGSGVLRAISVDELLPRVLALAPSSLPIPEPADFLFPGAAVSAAARRDALEGAYAATIPPLAPAAVSSLEAIDLLGGVDFAGYVPANGAVYGADPFSQAMRSIAVLIKAGIGLEVAHYDYGGWDHHSAQGPIQGTLAGMLASLSEGLAALRLDMQGRESEYVLYAKSEFGRRAAENGSAGTDHGSGGMMMVMGKGVVGGQVHGSWPTLQAAALDEGDLAVTTDYRDVLAEILTNAVGGTDLSYVFSGHAPTPLGVVL